MRSLEPEMNSPRQREIAVELPFFSREEAQLEQSS